MQTAFRRSKAATLSAIAPAAKAKEPTRLERDVENVSLTLLLLC